MNLPRIDLSRHYPTPGARVADLIVHLTGLVLALFGGGVLLGLAVSRGDVGLIEPAGLMWSVVTESPKIASARAARMFVRPPGSSVKSSKNGGSAI